MSHCYLYIVSSADADTGILSYGKCARYHGTHKHVRGGGKTILAAQHKLKENVLAGPYAALWPKRKYESTHASLGARYKQLQSIMGPWRNDEYGMAVFGIKLRAIHLARAMLVETPYRKVEAKSNRWPSGIDQEIAELLSIGEPAIEAQMLAQVFKWRNGEKAHVAGVRALNKLPNADGYTKALFDECERQLAMIPTISYHELRDAALFVFGSLPDNSKYRSLMYQEKETIKYIRQRASV